MWWARHSQRRAEPAPHAEARKPHVTYPHDSRDPPSGLGCPHSLCSATPATPMANLPLCPPGISGRSQWEKHGREGGHLPTAPGGQGTRVPTHGRTLPAEARVTGPPRDSSTQSWGAAPTREPAHGRPRGGKDGAPDDVSSSTRAKTRGQLLTQAGGSMPHFLPSDRPTWSRLRAWPQRLRQRTGPAGSSWPAVRQQWVRG